MTHAELLITDQIITRYNHPATNYNVCQLNNAGILYNEGSAPNAGRDQQSPEREVLTIIELVHYDTVSNCLRII